MMVGPFLNASQLAGGQQSSYGPVQFRNGQMQQLYTPGWAGGMDSHNGTSRWVGDNLNPTWQTVPGWQQWMSQQRPATPAPTPTPAPTSMFQREMQTGGGYMHPGAGAQQPGVGGQSGNTLAAILSQLFNIGGR